MLLLLNICDARNCFLRDVVDLTEEEIVLILAYSEIREEDRKKRDQSSKNQTGKGRRFGR